MKSCSIFCLVQQQPVHLLKMVNANMYKISKGYKSVLLCVSQMFFVLLHGKSMDGNTNLCSTWAFQKLSTSGLASSY